ncbi:alpha/beta hydrolase [Deminuibacter soli]|nr:alpha/beta hydrolase [Deminuibacter soli]
MERISPRKAAESAFRLFCTPFVKLRIDTPPVFAHAEKRHFNFHGNPISGFYMKAPQPNGRCILIVHGFNSGSYRFADYATALLQLGYDVQAYDAPAHGTSGGKYITALLYRDMIVHIVKQYGPFHGIMAHSLGGLATALAAEVLQRPEMRIVLIAPATETTTAMQHYFKMVQLSPRLQPFIAQIIENLAHRPAEWFSVNRAVSTFKNPVLWLHDELDNLCPYLDTAPTRNSQLDNIQFVTTKGLGHSGIYRDKANQQRIIEFLTARA